MKAKYLRKVVVGNVTHKLDDSPIWCDLLKVKHLYLKGRTVKFKMVRLHYFGWIVGTRMVLCVLNILSYMCCVMRKKLLLKNSLS
jgi:hypothetical protein